MAQRAGSADLPLHGGQVPKWLADRMTRLSNTAVPSMAAVSLLGKSSSVQLDLYHNWYPFDFEEAAYGMSRIDFIAGGAAADSRNYWPR
jgi:hypothetical protein